MYKIPKRQFGSVLTLLRTLVFAIFAFAPLSAAAGDTYLLMAEEEGCLWCERWNEEISQIYPKSAEGKAAPLVRYDLHAETPENVTFKSRVHFTPTFILVKEGDEVGRIEGYPGEDFFWGLLSMLIDQAEIDLEPTG